MGTPGYRRAALCRAAPRAACQHHHRPTPSPVAQPLPHCPTAAIPLPPAQGDVTDPASLREALAGCSGIIFAASGKGYWSADGVDCKVGALCVLFREVYFASLQDCPICKWGGREEGRAGLF